MAMAPANKAANFAPIGARFLHSIPCTLFPIRSHYTLRLTVVPKSKPSWKGASSYWGEIFSDPVLATAILDRLLHHSTTIKGESYRLKKKRKVGLLSPTKENLPTAAG